MPVVVDSSVLVAAADAGDRAHARVRDAIAEERSEIVVPQTTVPEVCHLLRHRLGASAEVQFVEALAASPWRLEPLSGPDVKRCAELVARYADLPLGFVDASVVAIAERLGAIRIYTLDADFSMVRPRHVKAFELMPPP